MRNWYHSELRNGKALHLHPVPVTRAPSTGCCEQRHAQLLSFHLWPWTQALADDPVYLHEEQCCVYTKRDFIELVTAFATTHGLPCDLEHAHALWDLCAWQHPETLLEEDLRDHALWPDAQWPAAPERQRGTRGRLSQQP